ncbi:hypothetical protein PM082_011066 [Marasmius tenuissimus]|nr:hypothetical protein PM082_011066 [Marasmius tenuissimus]
MFEVLQPTDMKIVAEELEGRQDVEMAHDRADDVYCFLRSLLTNCILFYSPTATGPDNVHRHFVKRRRGSSFPSLSSTLHLSTKYILNQLSSGLPTTASASIYIHRSECSFTRSAFCRKAIDTPVRFSPRDVLFS